MKIFIISPIELYYKKYLATGEYDSNFLIFLKRFKELASKLQRANIDIKNASICGVDLEDNSLDHLLDSDTWTKEKNNLFPASKSCTLGHLVALKTIENQGINENVLILEDDADISENFLSLVPKKFPENYDVFIMHSSQENYDKQNTLWRENIKKITENPRGTFAAYTYFVNGKKIKHILSEILPLRYEIDVSLTGNNPKLNTYILNPKLKASAQSDYGFSVRQILNLKNFELYMRIIWPNKNFLNLKEGDIIKALVHKSMIYDVDINNLFKIYCINKNKEKIDITYLYEIYFPNCCGECLYCEAHFKLRGNHVFKHKNIYIIEIEYLYLRYNKNISVPLAFVYEKQGQGIGLDMFISEKTLTNF